MDEGLPEGCQRRRQGKNDLLDHWTQVIAFKGRLGKIHENNTENLAREKLAITSTRKITLIGKEI